MLCSARACNLEQRNCWFVWTVDIVEDWFNQLQDSRYGTRTEVTFDMRS